MYNRAFICNAASSDTDQMQKKPPKKIGPTEGVGDWRISAATVEIIRDSNWHTVSPS